MDTFISLLFSEVTIWVLVIVTGLFAAVRYLISTRPKK